MNANKQFNTVDPPYLQYTHYPSQKVWAKNVFYL